MRLKISVGFSIIPTHSKHSKTISSYYYYGFMSIRVLRSMSFLKRLTAFGRLTQVLDALTSGLPMQR